MRAACHNTRIRAFTDHTAPAHSVRAAVKVCEHCPIRRQCARAALTSGTSMDGSYTAPATTVIQAGIICHGDQATARALAAIAGVRPPRYRNKGTRPRPASHCLNCEQPMVPWTRGEVPAGHVMHYSKSFCTNCRGAYRQARNDTVTKQRPALRKQVDRKRHHPETAEARARTAARRAARQEKQRLAREERQRQADSYAAEHGLDLTTDQAAQLLRVTPHTISRLAREGAIPRHHIPGVNGDYFRTAEIAAAIGLPGDLEAQGYDLTAQEAADLAGVTTGMISRHATRGTLSRRAAPAGLGWRYKSAEVRALYPTDRRPTRPTMST